MPIRVSVTVRDKGSDDVVDERIGMPRVDQFNALLGKYKEGGNRFARPDVNVLA